MWKRLTAHPIRLILALAILVFALYEGAGRFVAYTGDAYVTSDIVILSAEVAGPISEIFVEDNQAVAAGDRLFAIDPAPYQLALDESRAALQQAEAERQLSVDQVAAAKAALTGAAAILSEADAAKGRSSDLSREGFATEAGLDLATRDAATASAGRMAAQSGLGVANQRVAVAIANVAAARAAVGRAEYRLARTAMAAPAAGYVAPFALLRGDYLQPGNDAMAIVTGERRRIVANVNERHLARLRVGQSAWVTLGSDPWSIHSGRVSSIAVAVARSAESGSVIPYVSPTTDWVRLPRRFPVEITLDAGAEATRQFPGADARVLIWF